MKHFFIAAACLFSIPALAEKKKPPPRLRPMAKASTGDFKVEKGMVNKIYEASVDSPTAQGRRNYGHNEIGPQVGFLVPIKMEVKNSYFDVRYTDQIAALPFAHLSVAVPFSEVGSVRFSGVGRVGFSYHQGIYKARTQESNIEAKDTLTLQWVPLFLGAKAETRLTGLPFVKPAFHLGGGTQYFSQSGSLDGINQTFWAPYALSGVSLTLFDASDRGNNIFGGVTLGGFYQDSLGSSQTLRGWSLELGSQVVM